MFNWIKNPLCSNENVTTYTCYFDDSSYAEVKAYKDGTVRGSAVRGFDVVKSFEKTTEMKPADMAHELEGAFKYWERASYKVFGE